MGKYLIYLLSFSFMFGCAHVSQKDCLQKDWHTEGMNDALAGKARADMSKIAESCSRFSMPNPPENQYSIGFEAGLKKYCTYERGRSYGERGQAYPNICHDAPNNFKGMFDGWSLGIDSYCNYDQGYASAKSGEIESSFCTNSAHPRYFSGYMAGAREYCSDPKTGFLRGKAGKRRFSKCPTDLENSFDSAFAQGAALHKEISLLDSRILSLRSREDNLREKDRAAEYTIRDFEYKIRSLDQDIETAERKEKKIQKELSECARKTDLCKVSYMNHLEEELSRASRDLGDYRRRSRELTLKLPGVYSDRTRFAIEIGNANRERIQLEHDLARLKAQDFFR